jgi:murein DD-endopeptidase MepM/ murein hydrolase activator NlpD
MLAARRLLAVALALLVVSGVLVPALGAGAATADDLEAARQKLADARAAANDTAAAFSEADHQLEETRAEIGKLQDSIAETKARASQLRAYARQRALFAYTHPSNSLESLIDADGTVDAARREQLLEQANQTDNDVVKQLGAVNAQLKSQQSQLEQREREQQQVSTELDAKLTKLQADQAAVQQAVDDLQAKLDAELALAAFLDAAEKARLEAEKAALAAQQTVSSGGPGQIIASPVTGPFQCPVLGAAYSDDYGGPSGHPGIDMMVPTGTPAVAVMAGTVSFVPNEGAGGNAAYLDGVDGNTYYYAHFSQFVGGARTVAQGEVIGLTGMTGNATAPHLHFEIRLGGPNGNKTDPYPTLRAAGC